MSAIKSSSGPCLPGRIFTRMQSTPSRSSGRPGWAFYRDVIGLKSIENRAPSIGFEFGGNQLWIDRVPGLSQAEIWLELITNDLLAASEHLKSANVVRCDDIEPLPEGFEAFWVSSPASIVHLVCQDVESW